jgi:hypothetical protein
MIRQESVQKTKAVISFGYEQRTWSNLKADALPRATAVLKYCALRAIGGATVATHG